VSIAESEREGAGRGGVAECFGEEVALRERVSAIVENELGFTSFMPLLSLLGFSRAPPHELVNPAHSPQWPRLVLVVQLLHQSTLQPHRALRPLSPIPL